MAYKDKDEFLDAFYDHIFPEGGDEPTDEDKQWFDDVVSKFFDNLETSDSGKSGESGGQNAPRRRRPSQRTNTSRRRRASSGSSEYGSKAFFG